MYIKGLLMEGTIHIDTMHLVVMYPYLDVFQNWYKYAVGVDHRKLREGIVVGDFVVRGGAGVYKISVWQNDARAFLTDQVDEKIGEGKGAGIWLQLGPKFLIQHAHELHKAIHELLTALGVRENYPIRITRVDVALDLFGVEIKEQLLTDCQVGWVGRSKVSGAHFNSRTGKLETIEIGSRKSAIFLRIYDKIAQAVKEGDIDYWFDVWGVNSEPVTRLEWEVKPCEGHFGKDLQEFERFEPSFSVKELLNYLVDWGRLCVPSPSDSNNRRWQESPLWSKVRNLIMANSEGVDWPMSRYGKEFHGISEAYARQVSGTISGAMARFGKDEPDVMKMFEGLAEYGEGPEKINERTKQKAAVFSRL
jgi:hypothetical protein